jgi:hypothetical protein
MRLFILLAAALGLFAAISSTAADIPLDDSTIVLGKRVGPIEKGMTLTGLKTLLGAKKVKASKLPGPEGTEIEGVSLFAGTDRELEVILDPEGNEKAIFDIRILGKAWKFENGLRPGMTIAEVEKINGKPFQIMGFNWDYGGYANFEGGKLEGQISLRFDAGEKEVPVELSGDRQVPSTHKKLRALNPKVSELTVFFR